MAKVLTKFDFPTSENRKRYPDEWFDGKIRELTSKDFGPTGVDPHEKKTPLKMKARTMGKFLNVSTEKPGVLVIQAFDEKKPSGKKGGKKGKKRKA